MPTQGSPTRCDSTMPPVPGRTRGTPSWPMRYGELPTSGEATCPSTVIMTSSPALIRGEPGLRVGTTDDPVTAASVTPARARICGRIYRPIDRERARNDRRQRRPPAAATAAAPAPAAPGGGRGGVGGAGDP